MINNDILRRLNTIFDFTDEQVINIFSLGGGSVSAEQLAAFYKEKNDSGYNALLDVELASFLNGLIIEKRGQKEGVVREAEKELSNNIIFNKVKIALALKADEVIAVLELAELSLGKYELSAFFRSTHHKHYRDCSDEVLSAFLKGLKIQSSQ